MIRNGISCDLQNRLSDYLLTEKRQVASTLWNCYLITEIPLTGHGSDPLLRYVVKPTITGRLNICIAAPWAGIFITETSCR
jgi:hypothetical protein